MGVYEICFVLMTTAFGADVELGMLIIHRVTKVTVQVNFCHCIILLHIDEQTQRWSA